MGNRSLCRSSESSGFSLLVHPLVVETFDCLSSVFASNVFVFGLSADDEDGMDAADNERRPHFPQFSYSASGRE